MTAVISTAALIRAIPDRYKAQYLDYLAWLKSHGVPLSIGSDCHSRYYDIDFATAEKMLASVGITDADCWRLPTRKNA